jgi:hypothetical protein
MGPNPTSWELVKNNACVGSKREKLEQKEVHIGPTENCEKS